jgi:hypothetical protein
MFISKSITSGTVILNNITFEEKIEIIKSVERGSENSFGVAQ